MNAKTLLFFSLLISIGFSASYEYMTDGMSCVWINTTGNTTQNLSIVINKSLSSNTANGSRVFEFFEDCENALDTATKWTVNGGTPTCTNGKIQIDADDSMITKTSFSKNHSVICSSNMSTNAGGMYAIGFIVFSPNLRIATYLTVNTLGTNYYLAGYDGSFTRTATGVVADYTQYKTFKMVLVSGKMESTINGTPTINITTNVPTEATLPMGFSGGGGALTSYHEWCAVAEEMLPGPTSTTCGALSASRVQCNISYSQNLTGYPVCIPYANVGDSNLTVEDYSGEPPPPPATCNVSITLTSPANDAYSTISNQTLIANATGNPCTNMTGQFYLDGVNIANSSLLTNNGTFNTTYVATLGTHNWYVFLYGDDNKSYNATSTTRNFTIQYFPTITLTSPTDGSTSAASSQTLTATAGMTANSTLRFYLDGALVNEQNITTNGSYTYEATISTLGAHTWYAYLFKQGEEAGNATSSTFTFYKVEATPLTDGFFAYDSGGIPGEEEITADIGNYSFTLYGFVLNYSNFQSELERFLLEENYTFTSLSTPSYMVLSFGMANYSNYSGVCTDMNNNMTILKLYPYADATAFIVLRPDSGTVGNKTLFVNEVSKCIMNATGNRFNIYSEFLNNTLDTDYVRNFSLAKIDDTGNLTQSIISERDFMRNTTSKTRIYYGNNSTFKAWAYSFFTGVIQNLRGTPKGEAFADDVNVAEIDNGDVVIFNAGSAANMSINLTSKSPNDGWDKVAKALYADINDTENTSVEVQANNATMLLIDNYTRMFMTSASQSTLYKDALGYVYEQNYWSGGTAAGQWQILGSYDYMVELWDGSFTRTGTFFHSYEQSAYMQETDFSEYGAIVISADGPNTPAVVNASFTEAERNVTFLYMAVSDYVNDTAGTDCTVENAWELSKKAVINNFHINYSVRGIFTDGFDIGYYGGGVEKKCFETRIKRLLDYERALGEVSIANTYTIYTTIAHYADYVMRESCFSRWDGAVASPNYTYENMTLMIENAEFMTATGKPVLCMAFGAVDDYDKMAYDFHAYAVLYGTKNNFFRYGQPDFQVQREARVPNLGTQVQDKYIKANDTDWYREYANGIAHFDPTRTHTFANGKYYWFDDGKTVHNVTFYGTFWKVGAGACDANHNLYVALNWNTSTQQEVDECTVEANGWGNQIALNFTPGDYSENGHYWAWVYPKFRTDPNGMYAYSYADTEHGQHCYYKSSVTHPPSFDYNNVLSWRTGTPGDEDTSTLRMNLSINQSTSKAVDTGIDKITLSTSGFNYTDGTLNYWGTNVSVDSTKEYNITTISYLGWTAYTDLLGVYLGTTLLNLTEGDDCTSNNPTFNYSTVDGETHGACRRTLGSGYYYRFSSPHMSGFTYEILVGNQTVYVNVTAANLTPNPALKTQDLTCSFTLASNYFNITNVTVKWMNGTANPINTSLENQSITALSAVLGSGNLSKGDTWMCNVSANSSGAWSYLESNNITVLNDTCDCPSPAANWLMNMSNGCRMDTACDITGYNLSLFESGAFTINNTLTIFNLVNLTVGDVIYVTPAGKIIVGAS